jgi:hypothetical protein
MQVDVQHNLPWLERRLSRIRRQIPFATSKAINETAKDSQKYQRAYQLRAFDVTRRTFMERSVKIKPFAKKRSLWARIQIEPPGGKKRADVIAKFEKGGRKTAKSGQHVAVPIAGPRLTRRTRARPNIPSRYGPFEPRKGQPTVLEGKKRTFVVTRGSKAGVYQRIGRARKGKFRLLYTFKQSVTIDRRLNFIRNIKRIVNQRWDRNFSRAFRQAMRTAR